MKRMAVDLLVVGAGPTGCVFAERAATVLNWRVLVVEKRDHVGGNCHDPLHPSGVRIHRYGPHYFRTNSKRVVAYLSRFTEWIPARYEVKTLVDGALLPFPINLDTMQGFFGRAFSPRSACAFLRRQQLPLPVVKTSEQYLLKTVGRELYEAFYAQYTAKQWGRHPSQLSASVCARVPIRFSRETRYSEHIFQQMPRDGYTALFQRMLSHPNIQVWLNCEYAAIRHWVRARHATVYSGPLDEFFGLAKGKLPWRSLRFEFKTIDAEFVQPCVQINYPDERAYTRSVEIKHVTGQQHPRTVIAYEFPSEAGEPFYPIPSTETAALVAAYRTLARQAWEKERVIFAGRLATYQYLDIDQVVLRSLRMFDRQIRPLSRNDSD